VNFLNPLYLAGLAAAAIPIIIHLFTRRRPREVRFPSLEFLSEVNQSEIRRLRLKQWLLLLLRTLAIAALAMAMSRPALRGTAGTRGEAATTVVVLLDRSGSMGAAGHAGTLFADARRVVEDLLATLAPGDELLLVPYDERPAPFTPRPVSDLPRLRAALQALTPGARTTNHPAALATAARALEQSHALNRELFWLSDFQAAGATDSAARASGARGTQGAAALEVPGPWDRARVYLVPFAPASRANVALSDASLAPVEEGAALSVSAIAFGARAGDLAVEVREGDRPLGRGFLPLPENGEASTLLPLAGTPAQGGEVRLPDDALPLDNRRVFAAGRGGTLRVVLREDEGPSPLRFALEAGSPASGLAVESVSGGDLGARAPQADVLVIGDVERLGAAETQAVLDFHRAGGPVLAAPGKRADPGWWNSALLPELGLGRLGPLTQAGGGAAWRLMIASAGHPVLAGFPSRPGEALSSARFLAIHAFTPAPTARVLLRFDAAHPALIEGARALLFAAPLDPQSSDFPVSGAFLPLFHQAVKVLGRGSAAPSLVPGEHYSAPAVTGEWRIVDEAGHEVPSHLEARGGGTRLVSDPLEHPGLYHVTLGGEPRASFAVNPDVRESDLAALPMPTLLSVFPAGRAQVLQPGADLARRVREARYGRELWGEFLLLALLLLVAESVVGRWGMTSPAASAGGTGQARSA
jgi:hypothetical protein